VRGSTIGRMCSTLPARHGGLGLLSHQDCAPHASAAAEESSDVVVDQLFGMTADSDDTPARSQEERCKKMWEVQLDRLATQVGELRTGILIENASVVGRKWLNTIPCEFTSSSLWSSAPGVYSRRVRSRSWMRGRWRWGRWRRAGCWKPSACCYSFLGHAFTNTACFSTEPEESDGVGARTEGLDPTGLYMDRRMY